MISTNDFKTNVTIEFEGNIYRVIEFLHVKPGKGAAFVRTKLRNLRTGGIIDHTFNAGVKLKKAQINKIPMQYLYADGNKHIFMNNENYEQIEIEENMINNEIRFLPEGATADVIFFNDSEILGINLADNVVLKVIETVAGVKGDTKTNAMKDAKLETGIIIKVPMFIEEETKIVVSTHEGTYVSREK